MPRDGTATRDRLLDSAQQLVLERGFAATSVDAVLAGAGATKGAFFHHFPSKQALGRALVERYAEMDAELLALLQAQASAASDDPVAQLIVLARGFEEAAGELSYEQPGCMFAAFIREKGLVGRDIDEIVMHTIDVWHAAVLERLTAAARVHPVPPGVDLDSLADHLFVAFEGGFILARATGDPARLREQIAHARYYLELLFGVASR